MSTLWKPKSRFYLALWRLLLLLLSLVLATVVSLVMVQAAESSVKALAVIGALLGLFSFVYAVIQVLEVFVMLPGIAAATEGFRRLWVVLLAASLALVAPAASLMVPLSLLHGVYASVNEIPVASWYSNLGQATYGLFGLPNAFDDPAAAPLALAQTILALLYTGVLVSAFASVAASTLYQFSDVAKAKSDGPVSARSLQVRVEVSRWPWGKPKVEVIDVTACSSKDKGSA